MDRKRGAGGFLSSGAWRLPVLALGVFLVLAGLATWLVLGTFDNPPRFLLAGGILLLGIYVAADPEDVWGNVTGRDVLVGSNTLLLGVAALVILGLLNVLGNRFQAQWDLTSNKKFTLTAQTLAVDAALPQPVHATAWFTAGNPSESDFRLLLDRYAANSGGKLTYEFIDPNAQPGLAAQAGILADGTTVFQMIDKKQNSTGTQESDVTNALLKLVRPSKKIYFTAGHGEHSLDGFQNNDYGSLKGLLERDNFATAPLSLITTRTVPDDADALVIAGPTAPFLTEEKDAIKAYLDRGGRLMLLLDPQSKADFTDVLAPYGVSFGAGTVVDPSANFFGQDPRVPVVQKYGAHVTTEGLAQVSFFPLTTAISLPSPAPQGDVDVAIAQSSPQSWENMGTQIQQQATDPKGPLTLVAAVERPLSGVAPPTGTAPTAATRHTRLYLYGSSRAVSNSALQAANPDLFLNAANWLVDQEDLINIKPPPAANTSITLSGTQMNLIKFTGVLFLPLAVLAVGAAVWWTRR